MNNTLEEDTQNSVEPKSQTSLILNVILAIVILAMGIYGFMYGNIGSISKNDLDNDYIKKTDVSFNILSSSEKSRYISKSTYLDEMDKLKNQEPKIIYKDKIVEKLVEKIVYKDKSVIPKEKIVEKLVEKVVYKDKIIKADSQIIEKTVYRDKVIDKSKFNTFRCYGMSPSGYRMSAKCDNNLKEFLEENKSAKYFEVIAVMNPKDFRTIMIMEQKTELLKEIDLNKKQVQTLKELSTVGLDKLRVIETIWGVKKILGKKNYCSTSIL